MQNTLRPDLEPFSERLSSDNARVTKFIEGLGGRIDKIAVAAQHQNWPQVQRLSEYLAHGSRQCGYSALAQRAERLCEQARQPENPLGIRQELIRLIGASGTARQSELQHGTSLTRAQRASDDETCCGV